MAEHPVHPSPVRHDDAEEDFGHALEHRLFTPKREYNFSKLHPTGASQHPESVKRRSIIAKKEGLDAAKFTIRETARSRRRHRKDALKKTAKFQAMNEDEKAAAFKDIEETIKREIAASDREAEKAWREKTQHSGGDSASPPSNTPVRVTHHQTTPGPYQYPHNYPQHTPQAQHNQQSPYGQHSQHAPSPTYYTPPANHNQYQTPPSRLSYNQSTSQSHTQQTYAPLAPMAPMAPRSSHATASAEHEPNLHNNDDIPIDHALLEQPNATVVGEDDSLAEKIKAVLSASHPSPPPPDKTVTPNIRGQRTNIKFDRLIPTGTSQHPTAEKRRRILSQKEGLGRAKFTIRETARSRRRNRKNALMKLPEWKNLSEEEKNEKMKEIEDRIQVEIQEADHEAEQQWAKVQKTEGDEEAAHHFADESINNSFYHDAYEADQHDDDQLQLEAEDAMDIDTEKHANKSIEAAGNAVMGTSADDMDVDKAEEAETAENSEEGFETIEVQEVEATEEEEEIEEAKQVPNTLGRRTTAKKASSQSSAELTPPMSTVEASPAVSSRQPSPRKRPSTKGALPEKVRLHKTKSTPKRRRIVPIEFESPKPEPVTKLVMVSEHKEISEPMAGSSSRRVTRSRRVVEEVVEAPEEEQTTAIKSSQGNEAEAEPEEATVEEATNENETPGKRRGRGRPKRPEVTIPMGTPTSSKKPKATTSKVNEKTSVTTPSRSTRSQKRGRSPPTTVGSRDSVELGTPLRRSGRRIKHPKQFDEVYSNPSKNETPEREMAIAAEDDEDDAMEVDREEEVTDNLAKTTKTPEKSKKRFRTSEDWWSGEEEASPEKPRTKKIRINTPKAPKFKEVEVEGPAHQLFTELEVEETEDVITNSGSTNTPKSSGLLSTIASFGTGMLKNFSFGWGKRSD